MENISPIIFFILYLAFTGWVRQRKAKAKREAAAPKSTSSRPVAGPKPKRSAGPSFFEQIKQELMDMQEDTKVVPPPFMQQAVEVEVAPEPEPVPEPVEEGSGSIREFRRAEEESMKIREERPDHVTIWDDVLESYSTIERGIILREVLGKPKALQPRDQWIHG